MKNDSRVNTSDVKLATSNCVDTGFVYSQQEWMPWSGSKVCPECGSHEIEYNTRIVLTSYPAQAQLRCKTCGHIFSSGINTNDSLDNIHKYDQSILNIPRAGDWPLSTLLRDTTPYEGIQGVVSAYGWICPRCGKVNAPRKDSCDCSIKNITTCDTVTVSKEGNLQ